MAQKAFIGVDIGGTSVRLGVVNSSGRILARESFLTTSALGRTAFLDVLSGHISDLKKEAAKRGLRVAGVGIGAPGPIDVERGFVYSFPNIPGWKNTPLKAILEKRLKMTVRVDNDANAMALGECRFGAGKGARYLIALTLGTGVGGGLVIGGKLFHGSTFSAAEIGHIIVDPGGVRCGCGNHGCIETFVGSRYFVERARRMLKGGKSLLKQWVREGAELAPPLVAKAARSGDRLSKELWNETGDRLGTMLAGLCNVLNPERVVIGGGIAQNGGLLFGPLKRALRKKAFPIAARSAKVVSARLGVDAGLIGAAALAMPTEL